MDDLRDAARRILECLDLKAEYESLGVKFPKNARVRNNGYVECFAYDREEKSPSAAISTKGKSIGRYVDKGGKGLNLTFFDFCSHFFPSRWTTWQAARAYYAKQTGIRLSSPKASATDENIKFLDKTNPRHALRIWTQKKGSISAQACVDMGVRMALWPRKAVTQSIVFAFPVFKPNVDAPCGWVMVNSTGGPLRLYRGPDRDATMEKVLSLTGSESGMLNVYGCKHLADAKYVWLVEGLTDCAAGHTLIPRELHGEHVVIANSGGATEHPKPEWIKALAGKTIFLIRDADVPGRAGAERWGGVLAHSSTVHDVQLPYDIADKNGKDLRDWINDGLTFERLFDVAKMSPTFKAAELVAEPVAPSLDSSILEDKLQIVILGEHDDGSIEAYSQHYRKLFTIPNIQTLGMSLLLQCAGEPAQRNVTDVRGEIPPGSLTLTMVRNMIALEAGKVRLSAKSTLGIGCWRVESSGDIAIVDSGRVGLWNGKSLSVANTPRIGRQIIDFSSHDSWCDFGELSKILDNMTHEKAEEAFNDLADTCSLWRWKHKADAEVAASTAMSTMVQTLWHWRPMVAVSGGSDSGKSTFFDRLLQHIMGGPEFAFYTNKPTEAGLRQRVKNTAVPVIIDEMESNHHRQHVMELIRTSSRGGQVSRGTSNGRGLSFGLKHIVWIAAIENGLKREPDANRFILLDLRRPVREKRGKLALPLTSSIRQLGMRLLAAAIKYVDAAIKIASEVQSTQIPKVPGRVVESYSVPAAMLAAIRNKGKEGAIEILHHFLEGRFEDNAVELDEDELVRDIVHSQIHIGGGVTLTPSEIMTQSRHNIHRGDLERNGISLCFSRRGPRVGDHEPDFVFFSPKTIQRYLLKGTRWTEDVDTSTLLLRIEGSKREQCSIKGRRVHGISVPYHRVVSMSSDVQQELLLEHGQ